MKILAVYLAPPSADISSSMECSSMSANSRELSNLKRAACAFVEVSRPLDELSPTRSSTTENASAVPNSDDSAPEYFVLAYCCGDKVDPPSNLPSRSLAWCTKNVS